MNLGRRYEYCIIGFSIWSVVSNFFSSARSPFVRHIKPPIVTMLANPPHIITLPNLAAQGVDFQATISNPEQIIAHWLSSFEDVLKKEEFDSVATLFRPDCWWRDHLALTWDLRTLHSLDAVNNYVRQQIKGAKHQFFSLRARTTGKYKPTLANPRENVRWIESRFDFETNAGRGIRGFRTSCPCGWCWTIWTMCWRPARANGHAYIGHRQE